MNLFKFFNTNTTNYSGEWSEMAIRMVIEYVSGRFTSGQRVVTQDAECVIVETSYQQGELVGAVVKIYPTRVANTVITFWITIGRVRPFITDHSIVYEDV